MDRLTESGVLEAIRVATPEKTQAAFAEALGVSQQAVSMWVSQGFVPRHRAIQIERRYGVPRMRLLDPALVELLNDRRA